MFAVIMGYGLMLLKTSYTTNSGRKHKFADEKVALEQTNRIYSLFC